MSINDNLMHFYHIKTEVNHLSYLTLLIINVMQRLNFNKEKSIKNTKY